MVRYRTSYYSETSNTQQTQSELQYNQTTEYLSSDPPTANHNRIPRTKQKDLRRCLTKLWIYLTIQIIYLAYLACLRSSFLSLEALSISIPSLLLHNNGEILSKGWINTNKKAHSLKGGLVMVVLLYLSQLFRIGLRLEWSIESLVIQSLFKIIFFYLAVVHDTLKIWDLRNKNRNTVI